MNYARIYAAFIDDRRAKQPQAPDYFEKHHIKPRCLGGGDEPENIIRLTPEDHLFAHLLLAWIHGGKLWSAIFLMKGAGRRSGGWPVRRIARHHRLVYGIARRRHAAEERGKDGLKGSDNGNYNPTIYQWRHLDTGERHSATLHGMWERFGGARATWTSAVTPGSGKHSANGWALDDGVQRIRSSKGREFRFINRDGREFVGTQQAFCEMAGVSVAGGSRVVRHASVTACGWRLHGVEDRHHLSRKSDGQPARMSSGKLYIASKDGRVVRGTRCEVAKAIGATGQQFSAGVVQIATGKMKTYKGWRVQWQDKLI